MACRSINPGAVNGLNKDVAFTFAPQPPHFHLSFTQKHTFDLGHHETRLLSIMSSAAHPLPLDGEEAIEHEIRELEAQLARAKLRLKAPGSRRDNNSSNQVTVPIIYGKTSSNSSPHQQDAEEDAQQETSLNGGRGEGGGGGAAPSTPAPPHLQIDPTTHFLLLLADSALPLGAFAFSSGLESYIAHHRHHHHAHAAHPKQQRRPAATASFDTVFLPLSVASYAATTLPFLLAAHRNPAELAALDDTLDAAVVCTVGKRASVAQGRALLGLWERSFYASSSSSSSPGGPCNTSSCCDTTDKKQVALRALAEYTTLLRGTPPPPPPSSSRTAGAGAGTAATTPLDLPPPVSAHLAPLFGVVAALLGLSLQQTAYVFVLGHVKALVSAAVRANLMGPYAAQKVLASGATQAMIAAAVEREWETPYEEAGQSVPVMDLWVGRHEMLYSRIFNS